MTPVDHNHPYVPLVAGIGFWRGGDGKTVAVDGGSPSFACFRHINVAYTGKCHFIYTCLSLSEIRVRRVDCKAEVVHSRHRE